MLLWSTRVNAAVFGVFLTLQITEVLLVIGFFLEASGRAPANNWWLHAGGWAGIVTAAVAWYTSAAGVVNGMSPRPVVPVGTPFWGELPGGARRPSPMPRRAEG
jgi:succinate-acetate transporter protein